MVRILISGWLILGVVVHAAAQSPDVKLKFSPAQLEKLSESRSLWKNADALRKELKFAEEAEVREKILKLETEVFGRTQAETLLALELVILAYEKACDFSAAKEAWQRLFDLRSQAFGRDHWQTTDAKRAIAHAEAMTRMTNEQLQEILQAEQLGHDAEELYPKGKYREMDPLLQKALAIHRKILGEEHLLTAYSYNILAVNLSSLGKVAEAEPLHQKALAIRKKVLGEEHPETARSYNNIALLLDELGKHAEAEPLLRKALAIRRKALGEEQWPTAYSYVSVALNLDRQERHAEAEPIHQKALAIRKKVLGEEHPHTAASYYFIAVNLDAQGKYAEAEPLYRKALAIRKIVLGEEHSHTAQSYNNIASNLDAQRKHTDAEPLHQKALAIYKKALGEEHPSTAASYNKVASNLTWLGKHAEAEPIYRKAVSIIAAHLEESAAYQSESDQLAHAKSTKRYFDNMLNGTRKAEASTTYDLLFKLRGAITARQYFARAARTSDPAIQKLLGEMQQLSQQISQWTNNPPKGSEVNIAKTLERLTGEFEMKQKELAAKSSTFRKYEENKKLTPADLQKKLPADAVLIDFLMFNDELAAFVVTPKAIYRVDLGKLEPIADAVDEFRKTLGRVHPLTGKPDDPAIVLRDKLLAPLREHTKNAKLLLIAPDGPLCRLPFAALPGVDEKKYLIEEQPVVILPAPRLIFELLAERPEKAGLPSMLAMGNVRFDAEVQAPVKEAKALEKVAEADGWKRKRGGEGSDQIQWKALEDTLFEINNIKATFTKVLPKAKYEELSETDATEFALRDKLPNYEFIHLATHGFFSPASKIKLPTTDQRPPGDDGPRYFGPNPYLLSGIVCAGANKPKPDASGVITAMEILDMDLSKVELVVLSACDTGLGESAGGEGVLGLQRAFQLAGARSTVTSLWEVRDQATAQLMSRFYENYFKGRDGKPLGTLEALREAQLNMLKDGVRGGLTLPKDPRSEGRTPPLYWAAFTLSGDWR